MKTLEARAGRKAVKDSVTVWRPWQLKQFELFQGAAFSAPSYQHFTQEYLIIYGQAGTAKFQYRNTCISGQIVNRMLVVIEPGETWNIHLKDATFYHLSLDPAWLQETIAEMLHWEKGLPHFSSHPFFEASLSRAVYDLATRSQAPASRLQQEEAQLNILAPLLHMHAKGAGAHPRFGWEHPAVKRAKDYLQAHYVEEVTLQELASVANMSPFHLARVFRQVVGLPPHAYQIQLRLAHARTLLAQGYEVGYVASFTGFFDQSHFTQQFKRRYLVTPGSYRRTARFS
jgi:AraC-like DNA-binding protein